MSTTESNTFADIAKRIDAAYLHLAATDPKNFTDTITYLISADTFHRDGTGLLHSLKPFSPSDAYADALVLCHRAAVWSWMAESVDDKRNDEESWAAAQAARDEAAPADAANANNEAYYRVTRRPLDPVDARLAEYGAKETAKMLAKQAAYEARAKT